MTFLGQDLEKRAALPPRQFIGVPPRGASTFYDHKQSNLSKFHLILYNSFSSVHTEMNAVEIPCSVAC